MTIVRRWPLAHICAAECGSGETSPVQTLLDLHVVLLLKPECSASMPRFDAPAECQMLQGSTRRTLLDFKRNDMSATADANESA